MSIRRWLLTFVMLCVAMTSPGSAKPLRVPVRKAAAAKWLTEVHVPVEAVPS